MKVIYQLLEGLKLNLGIRVRKVLGDLDFAGVWSHALDSEHCAIEGNLRPPNVTLSAVKDNAMIFGNLHWLKQVYDNFSSKWMFQKPSFVPSLLKHVAALRQ